jgi:hypothetical protein
MLLLKLSLSVELASDDPPGKPRRAIEMGTVRFLRDCLLCWLF